MRTLVGGQWPSEFYFRLSGTSMAAPVVAGAAALLLQQNPNLSPDTVKARLMISADKWVNALGVGDACTYGAGYLDILSALQNTVTVPTGTYALSPLLEEDGQGNVSLALDPSVYGSRALWGKSGIWGANVTDLRAIWGKIAIFGSATGPLAASSVLWASRAIWGKSVPGVDLSATAINGE